MKKSSFYMPVLLFIVIVAVAVSCGGSGLPGPGTVTFTDIDMGSGQIGGTIIIERSADEGQITSYVIYWGSSANQKLEGAEPIAEIAVSETSLTADIPENTPLPEGATHVLAYVKAGNRESDEFESAEVVDLGSTVTVTLNQSLSDIDSFALTVSGTDMDDVTASGSSSTSQFVVEVPDGQERTFEVTASVSDTSDSAALTFSGIVTRDLTAGEPAAVTVPVDQLASTKIVIPDPGYYKYRLVQIDGMSGGGWSTLDYNFNARFTYSEDFRPWDTDFDNQGRIYIANRTAGVSGDLGRVLRIDNINGDNFYEYPDAGYGLMCLTVDRNNELLYYADLNGTLHQCNLDGTGHVALDDGGISSYRGMAVDSDGILYIAIWDGDEENEIFTFDPSTETELESYGELDTNITEAWDIMVKEPFVYLANNQAPDGYQIIQFNKSLEIVDHFGDIAADYADPQTGEFLGAHRFVAILNRKITIMDEYGDSSSDDERLLAFNDMDGSDWKTITGTEAGGDAFAFLETY